jgi:hypothetical protein
MEVGMVGSEYARAFPCGVCWCGCGARLADSRVFFLVGHDKRAEARVIRERYGDVASFLLAHGYGPPAGAGTDGGAA